MSDAYHAKLLIINKLKEYAQGLLESGDIGMFGGIMAAIEKIEDIEV